MVYAPVNQSEVVGLGLVGQIVREDMNSRWQEVSQQNDDAVDGIMFLQKRSRSALTMAYTQVKSGGSYLKRPPSYPEHIAVNLGKEYLRKHKPRWLGLPGPAILVYVLPSAPSGGPHRAWWADLKDPSTFPSTHPNYALLPKRQRFLGHSVGDIRKLDRDPHGDDLLPTVRMEDDELIVPKNAQTLHEVSREAYVDWRAAGAIHANLGTIEITRIGWRHINRRGRRLSRVTHSWLLLPVARKMIHASLPIMELGRTDRSQVGNHLKVRDFRGLRARVDFPHRDPAVVQVVLMRLRKLNLADGSLETRHWFYSVYEKRRASA